MSDCAELEIRLEPIRGGGDGAEGAEYSVQLRFSPPGADVDVQLLRNGPVPTRFDPQQLRAVDADPGEYGWRLAESLFVDEVARALGLARTNAGALGVPLRLRLFIDRSASELHALRWETLRDPADPTAPLLTKEEVLFSRYLESDDWQSVRPRPEHQIRALVAVANPANLATFEPEGRELAPIDVEGELTRAKDGLGQMRLGPGQVVVPVTELVGPGTVTLNGLTRCLRDGYEILYLVCHGALVEGRPHLWLEKEDGAAHVVDGEELVTRLRELQSRPRLIVLASCQSAGAGDTAHSSDRGVLAAIGPRLARMGVPAVVAMQGNVSMETVGRFMEAFFRELPNDWQIDRAVAVARGEVRDRDDHWMPALFMRLKSGQIGHYRPRFAADIGDGFARLPDLLDALGGGYCTPILGPGLTEPLLGSSREIARRWGREYGWPLSPDEQEDWPRVAQFFATTRQYPFVRRQLLASVRGAILDRYGGRLREGLSEDELDQKSLEEIVGTIGEWLRQEEPLEPHRILATLPCSIYVTTNADDLLQAALQAAGREPQFAALPWNARVDKTRTVLDVEPSRENPLVYHLFGRLERRESLVITEDDYFDYLINWDRNRELVPVEARQALVNTSLLYLGFQMDDWGFRAFYRSIAALPGSGLRDRNVHVAVQVDPSEGRMSDPEEARKYVQSFFQGQSISVYFGRVSDFMRELKGAWNARWDEDPDWRRGLKRIE